MLKEFVTTGTSSFEYALYGAGILDALPQNNLEELLVLGTIFVILFVVGIYLILNIRKSAKNDEQISNDELLLRFSKLYDEGKLTKEEYRQIKLRFAEKLKQEQKQPRSVKGNSEAAPRKKSKKKRKKKVPQTDTSAILQSLLDDSQSVSSSSFMASGHSSSSESSSILVSQDSSSSSILPVPPILSNSDGKSE